MKFLAKAIIFLILFGVSAVSFLALSKKTQAVDQFCVARIVVKTNVETWMEVDGKSLNLYKLYTQRDTTINQTNDSASTHKVEVYTNEWQDNKFVGKSFESNFEVKDFECFASSSDWSLEPVPTTTLSINLDTQKMEISVTPGTTPTPTTSPTTTTSPTPGLTASPGGIAGESAIRAALRTGGEHSGWVITAWKTVLGLANLGLVVILIFLAVVNILRIQYDTYAIKKALPILIIGIILANFSLLIVRMLVDFSNILTNLFTDNQTPGEFAARLIAGAGERLAPGSEIATDFASGGIGLGSLLIWFLFALFVMVAFLILGFLFYIRFAVVLILAIVAPLAFVAMAFPPTQGFFKQWWGWLTKFIFMKPIVFFLLYLAMQIRTAEDAMGHLTAWFIIAFLVYLAIIIPFKLGGVVMGAWGGVGKKAAGWLGNKADYAMAKYAKWSPKSAYQAYKMGSEQKREEAYAVATGKQRDVWNRALSLGKKRTQYYEAAKDAIAQRRYKEEVAEPLGESRTSFQRGFREALIGGDMQKLQGVIEAAQKAGMFDDIIEGIQEDPSLQAYLKRKGFNNEEIQDLKNNKNRSKMLKAIFGTNQEGLRIINRLQEAATVGGNATALDVFWDTAKNRFVEENRDDPDRMKEMRRRWKARFQSPDAWKSMPGLRKESFSDDEVLRDLIADGFFTPTHLTNLFRSRASTIEFLKSKIGVIHSAGEHGKALVEEMERRKYIPEEMAIPTTRVRTSQGDVEIDTSPVPPEARTKYPVGDNMFDARVKAKEIEVTPKDEALIIKRAQGYSEEDLKVLNERIKACATFSDDLKDRLNVHLSWAKKRTQAVDLINLEVDQAEAQMAGMISDISSQVGTAMSAGVDVSAKVKQVIDGIPELLKPQFRQRLKDSLRASDAQITTLVDGTAVQAREVIKFYEAAKTPRAGERTVSEDQLKLRFFDHLQRLGRFSPVQSDQAWQLAQAFEGGRAVRRPRSGRGRAPGGRAGAGAGPIRPGMTPEEIAAEEEELGEIE